MVRVRVVRVRVVRVRVVRVGVGARVGAQPLEVALR